MLTCLQSMSVNRSVLDIDVFDIVDGVDITVLETLTITTTMPKVGD